MSMLLGSSELIAQTGDRCPCTISRERLVELGDPAEPDGSINGPWATAFELEDGRWATVDFYLPFALRLFGRDGQFEGMVGREGDGPGEFRRIHEVLKWSGGIAVYDYGTGRLSLLNKELEFNRSVSVGSLIRLVPVSDTILVANAALGPAALEGHVVHVLDRTGRPTASFGGAHLPQDLTIGNSAMHRLMAASGDGASVWVAAPGAFRLQRYDLQGNLLQTVEPSVDWFPPGQGTDWPSRTRMFRPSPRINEIVQSGGLVWVLSHVADAEWREGVPKEYGESYHFNRLWDTRIDVFSEDRSEWVASTIVDEALRRVGMAARDGAIRVFNMRPEELGFWTVVVEELSVTKATSLRK
jgi:hypothetical protein